MKTSKEAVQRYITFVTNYDFKNDPLYKQGVLGVDWLSMYIAANDPIAKSQKQLAHIFPPVPETEYTDNLNKPEPDYRKSTGYDSPIADVIKLYGMILNLYDMAYKMRQYQNGNGSGGGLEGRVDGFS